MRESHTFGVFLTLTRLEEVFSRILPFSVIIIFITCNHTHLIDATPIKLINFNEYYVPNPLISINDTHYPRSCYTVPATSHI